MNTDSKMLNKILANQLQIYIKKMIPYVQIGFMSEIQVWLNVCKSINVIYHTNGLRDKNLVIVPIDAEKKSCNKIQCIFMIKALDRVRLEKTYLSIITLYMRNP